MKPSQEYLDSISKKLDSFNRINGFNPSGDKYLKDDFDVINYTGQVALNYMNKNKKESEIFIDPLFRDHNKY